MVYWHTTKTEHKPGIVSGLTIEMGMVYWHVFKGYWDLLEISVGYSPRVFIGYQRDIAQLH